MKKVLKFLGIVLLAALVWYFFIKPHDYIVNFEAKTIPGTINQSIKIWNSSLENAEVLSQTDVSHLSQRVHSGDSTYIYNWSITPIHDSLSKIRVGIKDLDHSLKNKLMVPFLDTDFEKRSRKTLLDFHEGLRQHLEEIKVTIVDEDESPSTFCACTSKKTSQHDKAGGMMNDYPLLSAVLVNNGIQLNGPPLIEVKKWHMDKDSIEFNFCFPIIRSEKLPQNPELSYKRLFPKRSLKAVYNGNYITSDRAWYALLDYAKRNDIEVEPTPIEVFFNNPNMGSDQKRWKAEIYMPIKENE